MFAEIVVPVEPDVRLTLTRQEAWCLREAIGWVNVDDLKKHIYGMDEEFYVELRDVVSNVCTVLFTPTTVD